MRKATTLCSDGGTVVIHLFCLQCLGEFVFNSFVLNTYLSEYGL